MWCRSEQVAKMVLSSRIFRILIIVVQFKDFIFEENKWKERKGLCHILRITYCDIINRLEICSLLGSVW